MTKLASSFSAAAILLGALLHAGAAGATSPTLARTWVSGSIGSNSNPCTRAAPCATFQAAHDATIAGGEIDVLDGGEFGAVTIFKAITIANDGGGTAAITPVTSDGVIVAAGASDAVVLRGLSLIGISSGGRIGIDWQGGGSLLIDHCKIQGNFGRGIDFEPAQFNGKLWMKDTVLSNNGSSGLLIAPIDGSTMTVELERVQILNASGNGVRADATIIPPGHGGLIDVELHDVTVDGGAGSGIVAVSPTSGGPTVKLLADHVTSTHNAGYGFRAVGGTASVYLRRSVAEDNGVGLNAASGGQLFSFGDNSVASNTGGAGTTPTAIPLE
jgi:hypothetical protein